MCGMCVCLCDECVSVCVCVCVYVCVCVGCAAEKSSRTEICATEIIVNRNILMIYVLINSCNTAQLYAIKYLKNLSTGVGWGGC